MLARCCRLRASVKTVALAPADALPHSRNSYADLLRTVAILAVVFGHWLATAVVSRDGRYVGVDALGVIHWGSWVTLLLQVIPVFFLVGGYANSGSWSRHAAAGEAWTAWVRARVLRLLIPTAVYIAVVAVAICCAEIANVDPKTLEQVGWALALHLWFVAAYVVVLLCTPTLMAAHRRWGLLVPAAMAVLAILIDTTVVGWHWHLIGWANYLFVWGTFHQLGFAWQDGRLTVGRRPELLAGAAVLVLIGLIWWGGYPVSMVGVPGADIQNASPPSTALLAFGLAQSGLVIAFEPSVTRWLSGRPRARSTITTAGAFTMPIYLWHMVPVVIVIEFGYPHLVGLPVVGSTRWWQQRPAWIGALALAMFLVLGVLVLIRRTLRSHQIWSSPADGTASGVRVSAPMLVLGVALAAVGIGQLAISGFAPDGRINVIPLLVLTLSLICVRMAASIPRGASDAEPAGAL